MPMTINTNTVSLNAQRNLMASQSTLNTAMQRLSSGMRVNSAKDDAAGLAIAERMNANIRGMNVAIRNANDAISLAQTGEGALGKVAESLQRMRELAVQAANATNNGTDRTNLNQEFSQLASEVDRVLGSTDFNGTKLFTTANNTQTFQVSASTDASQQADIVLENLKSHADISAVGSANLSTIAGATGAMAALDKAIDTVTSSRAKLGASQNRFESIIGQLQQASESMSASRGRIVDADFAVETSNLSRAQILQQAGSAMVAQANALPQQVLQLLRG